MSPEHPTGRKNDRDTFQKTTKEATSSQASKKTSTVKTQQTRTSVFDRLGSSNQPLTIQRTRSPFVPALSQRIPPSKYLWSRPGSSSRQTLTGYRWGLAWQALLTSGKACGGPAGPPTLSRRVGSQLSTMTSTHPSQHRVPYQEQPPGSPAGRGCPAVQGSCREGPERGVSRVLQPAIPGAEEDRGSASCHRFVYIESAPGGAALQNRNPGIRSSSHQEPRMDHLN